MSDFTDVKIEVFENGIAVVPESETRKVVIPSPPTTKFIPINPRPAVIYVTKEIITEASPGIDKLKEYAKENKLVFLCPGSADLEKMAAMYQLAIKRATTLNIKKDEFSVKADGASLDLANALVERLEEEGYEGEAAEEFSL